MASDAPGLLYVPQLVTGKRKVRGAFYTPYSECMLIVEPVIMMPLRREWATIQEQANALLATRGDGDNEPINQQVRDLLDTFRHHLATHRVLDPACGQGNFLHAALWSLLDLEQEVIMFGHESHVWEQEGAA